MIGYEIFDACRKGNLQLISDLHQTDAGVVNSTAGKGFTSLILSVENDEAAAIDFLLANGADVNAQDVAGITGLMSACFKG